jgi:hypothetical protein
MTAQHLQIWKMPQPLNPLGRCTIIINNPFPNGLSLGSVQFGVPYAGASYEGEGIWFFLFALFRGPDFLEASIYIYT